ncbi:MAG: hypothetical protein ACOCUA_02325 [archaeon]
MSDKVTLDGTEIEAGDKVKFDVDATDHKAASDGEYTVLIHSVGEVSGIDVAWIGDGNGNKVMYIREKVVRGGDHPTLALMRKTGEALGTMDGVEVV